MLKIENPISPFVNSKIWSQSKHGLIFKDKQSLDKYQRQFLSNICRHYRVYYDKSGIINCIPDFLHSKESIKLATSGSCSSQQRSYTYPLNAFSVIQNHLLWRIENEYGLRNRPYNVLLLYYERMKGEKFAYDFSESPSIASCGLDNNLYKLSYGKGLDAGSLQSAWKKVHSINPAIILGTPSQLNYLYSLIGEAIGLNDGLLIFSGEMLFDHHRNKFKKIFKHVIDKMRCWDGGLCFYECRYGRKHIYDELVYVEQAVGDQLICTDFFNTHTPFIKYDNGDKGILRQGYCGCGVYGNYFDKFYGISTDVIKINGELRDGYSLMQDIGLFLQHSGGIDQEFTHQMLKKYERFAKFIDIVYKLKQLKNGDFIFYYKSNKGSLSELQVQGLRDALNYIIFKKKFYDPDEKILNEVIIVEDDSFLYDVRGVRNKVFLIESEME